MERLNDIINKATQRRQYSQQQQQQQRAAQQQPYGSSRQPQGQRSAAPNQPVPPAQQHYAPQMPQIPPTPLVEQTRQMPAYRHTRASADQMAQQDQNGMQQGQNPQRTPNNPSNYSQQMSPNRQRHTGEESSRPIPQVAPLLSQTSVRPLHPSFPRQQQVPKTPPSSPMQQRSEARGGMSSRSAYYTQEQANSMPSSYARGDYQNDPNSNYQAPMPADVMIGDEEEVTMEYGDWEGENEEVASYQPREPETYAPTPTPNAPMASRNTYASQYAQPYAVREQYAAYAPEGELPSPQARDAQEMHRPPVAKHVPVTRIQEVTTYHNKTQSQSLDTAMETRFGPGAAAHMQHMQEPSRQLIARETLTPASTNIQMLTKAVCAKCKGAGYRRADVPFGHPNFGKPIACECKEAERKEKRRQQLVELSDLSAFHDKHFDNFNTRIPGIHPSVIEAWKEAYHFAQNPKGWLVFIGTNGCGKTHLASAIANQSLNDGMMVLFSVVPELLDHLRSAFAPTATQVYDQLFSKMREAELLVLDDLGAHYSTPWATEKLYQLLNYRYSWSMPTVITTNNVGLQSIDIRLSSRMMDSSLVTVVNLEHAKDRRPYLPRRDM